MHIITTYVLPTEKAEAYFIGPKQMPGFSDDDNPRMMEQIFVYRDDTIAKYETDLGPADNWPYVPPLMMPSFGEETVEALQWHGQRHLADDRWAKRMREYKESSTLFADIIRQEEQRHEIIRNRTSIGPYATVQRNGWAREHAWRRWRDERNRRTGKVQL